MDRDVVLVPYVPEEPGAVLGREESDTERVYGRVAEAFVVETAGAVEVVEVGFVGFGAEEVKVADLEVGEELAVVVFACVGRVEEPVEVGVWVD